MKNKTLLALFIVLLASGCTQTVQQKKENKETGFVVKAIDGDTIDLASGERVRLIGINSTERGEACYQEAKEELEKLVKGKSVEMKRDKTNLDKYGRILRYVYLNGVFVNEEMVKRGFAFAFPYEPDTRFREKFENAERFAEENGLGCLWEK